jgi:uncharacterized coiled-coil protein SlyX
MKTTTLSTNYVHRSLGRSALLSVSLLIGCFGLLPRAQAVGPDTDGNIPGSNNGEGIGVLVSRTSGVWNTGTGFEALNHLTAGNQNTATGFRALFSDTNGGFNTATGVLSLFSNTSGFFNSATGAYSLAHNTTGSYNTASGYGALYSNTDGEFNTANGWGALYYNFSGMNNTAVGRLALYNNTFGLSNTALGESALQSNRTGNSNTALGTSALVSNETSSRNTALGASAGSSITGNGNVCIGWAVFGEAGVDNTTYVRNVNTLTQNFSAGVNDYVTVRLSDGRLGHTAVVSSQRYKEDIKPLDKTSQALYALKPVSFRLKKEFDRTQALGFGLIAEEVEKVDPALVYRNDKGQVESVRYEMVNAMLLNEFLKEHCKVEEQQASITRLESTVAKQEAAVARQKGKIQSQEEIIAQQQKGMEVLAAQIKEQAAQIQKVSAQLEASKPAPQIVNNP